MIHTLEPIFDGTSKILILGSFPSVKSREENFYYANPQNRFWKVLSAIFGEVLPSTNEEKRRMLLKHKIALWDVVYSCDIQGSSDSSIQNVMPNDIGRILADSSITKIFGNGRKAQELYRKHCENELKIEIELLPSTSPANAGCSIAQLIEQWQILLAIELSNSSE